MPLAPLEIRTNSELGLQVPIGLVLLKLRTDIAQAVVVDAARGVVTLSSSDVDSETTSSETDSSSLNDTTINGVSIFS